MKTHPILFSTEMVQAILNERKTQTRRTKGLEELNQSTTTTDFKYRGMANGLPNTHSFSREWKGHWVETKHAICPYGKVGDVLWGREEHLITFSEDRKWIDVEFKDGLKVRYYYKDLSLNLISKLYKRKTIGKWQRARFLPKELARIFLEITNIRVERLKDISSDNAFKEGINYSYDEAEGYLYFDYMNNRYNLSSIESFRSLWQSINGEDSWDANPWVWVIEFKRILKPRNF